MGNDTNRGEYETRLLGLVVRCCGITPWLINLSSSVFTDVRRNT